MEKHVGIHHDCIVIQGRVCDPEGGNASAMKLFVYEEIDVYAARVRCHNLANHFLPVADNDVGGFNTDAPSKVAMHESLPTDPDEALRAMLCDLRQALPPWAARIKTFMLFRRSLQLRRGICQTAPP